jgi:hypothetical protein
MLYTHDSPALVHYDKHILSSIFHDILAQVLDQKRHICGFTILVPAWDGHFVLLFIREQQL